MCLFPFALVATVLLALTSIGVSALRSFLRRYLGNMGYNRFVLNFVSKDRECGLDRARKRHGSSKASQGPNQQSRYGVTIIVACPAETRRLRKGVACEHDALRSASHGLCLAHSTTPWKRRRRFEPQAASEN